MAQTTQTTQDTSQAPPRTASKAALKIAPQTAAQETRADTPQKIETAKPETAKPETAETGAEGMTNDEVLDAMTKANEAILQGMAEMQREVMDFGSARLREDIDTQEALSHCADLQATLQVQADFAQKALQHYAEETAKLLDLSAKVGRDCWGPFEDATRVAFQGVKIRRSD